LADPDAPFHRRDVRLLKDSRSSTVAEVEMLVAGVLRPVVYKRFLVKHWTDPWRSLLRRPSAVRSWILGQGLRERFLPTARPLAVGLRQRGFLTYEAYLLAATLTN